MCPVWVPGNEQLQIEIAAQQAEMQKVEREMRLMRERLPPDNQEALEMALAEVVGSQGAAFARQASFALATLFNCHGKVRVDG